MTFWPNLWDLIGWFFSVFILVAYLMVIFAVVGDLLRDRALSGWYKALWVIFLVLVPILTALVYLIARGRSMAERQAAAAASAQEAADTYIRDVAGYSPADEIAKAKALLDAGTITPADYEQLKGKALAHP